MKDDTTINPAVCRRCPGRARDNGLCLSCTANIKREADQTGAMRRITAGRPARA